MTKQTKAIVGENIKRLRGPRSVIEVADKVDVDRTYWYLLEKGAINFTINKLERIAALFRVSVNELMTDNPKSKKRASRHPAPIQVGGKRAS